MLTANEIRTLIHESIESAQAEALEAGIQFPVIFVTDEDVKKAFTAYGAHNFKLWKSSLQIAGGQCNIGGLIDELTKLLGPQTEEMILAMGGDEADASAMTRFFADRQGILVYTDNLVRVYQSQQATGGWDDDMTRRHVVNFTRGLLAHEARHAVQSPTLVDHKRYEKVLVACAEAGSAMAYMSSAEGQAEYFSRPEEMDAYAFQAEVEQHRCSFADLRTWRPENVA